MKKILLLFVGLALLVSCSSDDGNSESNKKERIIGNWLLVDYSDSSTPDISEILKEVPCAAKQMTTFNIDQTMVETSFYGDNCDEISFSTSNYEVEGEVLNTINTEGGFEPGSDSVVKFYIKELTASKLVIQCFYIDLGIGHPNPELTEEEYYTLTYKRIK